MSVFALAGVKSDSNSDLRLPIHVCCIVDAHMKSECQLRCFGCDRELLHSRCTKPFVQNLKVSWTLDKCNLFSKHGLLSTADAVTESMRKMHVPSVGSCICPTTPEFIVVSGMVFKNEVLTYVQKSWYKCILVGDESRYVCLQCFVQLRKKRRALVAWRKNET